MAVDKREAILARLFVVLSGTPGLVTTVRNRGELPTDKRPSCLLLDGDEKADEKAREKGRITAYPNTVVMDPEVYVALESGRKPQNEGVGQDLNAFRVAIIKRVLTDTVLRDLVGSNGEIFYGGCMTDLARNREMNGEIGLIFMFRYVLNPNDL
jgi:hypothetical protein